ncbi:hypothetical protein [Streptococcus suis]|nr:hypothetical protein [Streptococcus suis]
MNKVVDNDNFEFTEAVDSEFTFEEITDFDVALEQGCQDYM